MRCGVPPVEPHHATEHVCLFLSEVAGTDGAPHAAMFHLQSALRQQGAVNKARLGMI